MADQRRLFCPGPLEPMPMGMNCKTWYKDKLPSKCFPKNKKRLKLPNSLDSRRWVFVKEGVDDFRKGCPPCEGLVTQCPKEGFLPIIFHRARHPVPPKSWKKLPTEANLFSKFSPAQLARKAFVEDVEARLVPHPLSHYLNLAEDIPVELLLQVLEVLDPEKKLEDTWAYCQGTKEKPKERTKLPKTRPEILLELPKRTPRSGPSDLKEEDSSENDLPEEPPKKRLPKGVRDFCKWVATFGTTDINEEFLLKEFSINYKCKLTYNMLHMKKLEDIPSELKYIQGQKKLDEIKLSLQELDWEKKIQKSQYPYKPKHMKMRYGAWYLNPKFWKKHREDEPLLDPNRLHETEEYGFRRVQEERDILEDLYGTIAFKDFILSKGYRMPGILERLFIRKKWTYDSNRTPTVPSTKASSSAEECDEED
nr:protein FAM47E-like [Dasypus novemcinctus]